MADNETTTQENSGSQRKIFVIFFIISLLITTVIGVLIFRYFNRQSFFDFNFGSNPVKEESPVATVETGEPEEASSDVVQEITPTTKPDDVEFAGFGGVSSPTPTPKATPSTTPTPKPLASPSVSPTPKTEVKVQTNKGWTANNYKFGDIKGDTHLVVIGDTLWEISEGKYGEGKVWRKIADANSVRYMWNGNPLIVPGTTLSLPK